MEEYKVTDEMFNELLDRAEELLWSSFVWKESGGRTYVEMEKHSPEGEDFSMLIDFEEEDAANSFVRELRKYYEGFDADEHAEMWIDCRNRVSGVPQSIRDLIDDAEAIDKMIEEVADVLEEMNSQMRYDYREIKEEVPDEPEFDPFDFDGMEELAESASAKQATTHIEYKILMDEKFFEHLHMKRLVIDDEIPFPMSTLERMFRYAKYGYFPCRETKMKIVKALRELSDEQVELTESLYDGMD